MSDTTDSSGPNPEFASKLNAGLAAYLIDLVSSTVFSGIGVVLDEQ